MRITHHWIIFWVFEVFIAIHFCSSTWIYVAPYDLRAYGSASPPSPRSVWRWHPHGLAWLGESTSQPQADLVASRAAPRCWLGDLPASWMSLTLDFLWAYWFVVYNLFTGNAKTQTLKKEKKILFFLRNIPTTVEIIVMGLEMTWSEFVFSSEVWRHAHFIVLLKTIWYDENYFIY